MKRKTIIRAALLAAFSLIIIILGIFVFAIPSNEDTFDVPVSPMAIPEIDRFNIEGSASYSVPSQSPKPIPTEATPAVPMPSSTKEGDTFFTLTIKGKNISVAYGVEENTLDKCPGWLTTSAMPGKDGMCVVYGHRNRKHFRVLENVELDDEIFVTMQDGTVYTYSVCDITIYENTSDFVLPTLDGKTLVLATCYPFRYSGHAPGKCIVTGSLIP